ncbi:sensor histidine kinase [Salinibacter grassmerensis]|uniref:sensor histidine kinase n=1 Tax=Salinibacter grassmerensis TaxID=3040353 RepID=UPI0021E91420|nr:histidine kinase [Salinibacter grassmerensis]
MPESASSPSGTPPLRPAALGGLQGAVWIVYGIAYYLTLRPHQPFADLLWKQTLIAAGSGLLLSTGLGALYWTVGLRQRRPAWQGLILLVGGLSVGLLWYQGKAWGVDWANPFIAPVSGIASLRPGEGSILSGPATFPIVMLAWSGLYLGLAQWYAQQRQERRLLRADAEAQRAQLQMLRYQLNPHFFFNALNTIGALADEDPARVKTAVRELSGFLRYTLLDDEALNTPLRDEVTAAEHYLSVEKIRFEDDLQTEVDVTDEAAQQAVPSFLVLPLVENAVKHGPYTSPTPLRIRVTGTVAEEGLVVEVANTGHWRDSPPGPDGTDTGLDNVRTRLQTQYPEQHDFTLTEEDGWVRARIEIDTDALAPHA